MWIIAFAAPGIADRAKLRAVLIATGVGAVTAWGIIYLAGGYSWPVLFHHSFLGRLSYPETHSGTVAVADLLRIYLWESHPANLPFFALLFSLAGCGLLAGAVRRGGWTDPWAQRLLAGLTFIVLHWVVFPNDDRFFAPVYIMILVYCAELFSRSLGRTEKPEASSAAG